MKKKIVIKLKDIVNDAMDLVTDIQQKIKSDVDAVYERQIIDAKSFLGVLSIASYPLTMIIHSDDKEEIEIFKAICNKYEV